MTVGKLLVYGFILMALASCNAQLPPSQPTTAPVNPPFLRAALDTDVTSVGDDMSLHLKLDVPQDQLMILTLSVTYAEGVIQQFTKNSQGNSSEFIWTIPNDAASGSASYTVTMLDCGCGPFLSGSSSDRMSSGSLTGEFVVK